MDNYATHKHPAVRAWLARHPRITLHFTPTSGSWLNLVEVFFSIITRQAIRRGSHSSVKELIGAIERCSDGWNERCHPFVWTKTADELLDHCRPSQGHRLRDTSSKQQSLVSRLAASQPALVASPTGSQLHPPRRQREAQR